MSLLDLAGMWSSHPDPDRELASAQRIAAATASENADAHLALNDYDPDPEPGETLAERLHRVLGPRLTAVKD